LIPDLILRALGAVLLIAGFALGLTLLRFLPIRFRKPEYIAAASVVGLLASAWVALLGAWAFGYRWGLPGAALLLAAGAGLGWRRHQRWRAVISTRAFPASRDRRVWLALSIVMGSLLVARFLAQMLWTRQGAYFSATNTWGDLALHLSLLTRFAFQDHFTLEFPIFYGSKLSYPFLVDFLSGVLHRLGWTLQWALIVPGFALAFSFVQLLYFTAYRWFRSSSAAAIATVVFVANGAPAGIVYFWRDWRTSGKPLLEFLTHMEKMYAHLPDQGLHFSNVVTDYLLPQRSILFGLPVFLLISVLLREAWRRPRASRRVLAASAVLAGLLPFAHVHAFFVVMGVWGWLAVANSIRRRTLANPWVGCWILALGLAAPQVAWQFLGSYSGHFSHWQMWWLKGPDENPALFWFRNLGLALPLGIWVLVWLWRTRGSMGFHRHYYLALIALFALTNIYQFQPNMFDNMKFMVFSYLILAVYLGYTLSRWIARSRWSAGAAALTVASLSIAGALSIVRESQVSWMFSTPEEIAAARIFRQVIPSEARVLTSDQHNHFVPVLTGRRIVMGYRGWLWSYGIDYGQVERDVAAMYAGGAEAARLLEKYGIAYVCVGPSERSLLHPNEPFFDARYPVVIRSGPFVVYNVRPNGTGG
jgi:hypothetical protein